MSIWSRIKDAVFGQGQYQTVVVEDEEDGSVQYLTPEEMYEKYGVTDSKEHKRLQDWWIKAAAFMGTGVIWFISSLGVSQWLTGFHSLSWDFWIIAGYCGGFVYEFLGIALLFVAAREFEKGEWGKFAASLSGALFVALSSFAAQYLMLWTEAQRSMLDIPTQALAGLPLNRNAIIAFRGLLPTVLEFYLVFLVADKRKNIGVTIQERRKVQQDLHALEDDEDAQQQLSIARGATRSLLQHNAKLLDYQAKLLYDQMQTTLQPIQIGPVDNSDRLGPVSSNGHSQPAISHHSNGHVIPTIHNHTQNGHQPAFEEDNVYLDVVEVEEDEQPVVQRVAQEYHIEPVAKDNDLPVEEFFDGVEEDVDVDEEPIVVVRPKVLNIADRVKALQKQPPGPTALDLPPAKQAR
jgi:hypothetical protein